MPLMSWLSFAIALIFIFAIAFAALRASPILSLLIYGFSLLAIFDIEAAFRHYCHAAFADILAICDISYFAERTEAAGELAH
jgi:hypothetical protein